MYTSMHTYKNTHTQTRLYTYAYEDVCIYIHIYISVYTHIRIYTHTQIVIASMYLCNHTHILRSQMHHAPYTCWHPSGPNNTLPRVQPLAALGDCKEAGSKSGQPDKANRKGMDDSGVFVNFYVFALLSLSVYPILSIYPSIYLSIYLYIYLSVYPSICLSMSVCICARVLTHTHLSACTYRHICYLYTWTYEDRYVCVTNIAMFSQALGFNVVGIDRCRFFVGWAFERTPFFFSRPIFVCRFSVGPTPLRLRLSVEGGGSKRVAQLLRCKVDAFWMEALIGLGALRILDANIGNRCATAKNNKLRRTTNDGLHPNIRRTALKRCSMSDIVAIQKCSFRLLLGKCSRGLLLAAPDAMASPLAV